ncbi:MAG TPA: cytochrome c3 family protein [Kofleriaceae bacterium]
MGRIVRSALVVAVIAGCGAVDTRDDDPVLSSPGPLTVGHRELDEAGACNACHVDNQPQLDANKCIACHRAIGARVVQGKGLHASPLVRGKRCEICHADHRGRGYDALGWNHMAGGRDGFNHQLTGWPLDGAHRSATCTQCHTPQTQQGRPTFLGTDRLCGTCHTGPHEFAKPAFRACERCHTTKGWKPPRDALQFEHDDRVDARMPLLSAHGKLACARCHAGAVFNLGLTVPDRCDNCHQTPHANGPFAAVACSRCHSPTLRTFARTAFDHDEHTRFYLGGHKTLPCARCHSSQQTTKPSAACESCHADRSPHGKRFAALGSPPACGLCHTTSFDPALPRWRLGVFNHAKHTKFPLVGEHADVACRACHRGTGPTSFEKLDLAKGCTGCHRHTKVHEGQFTNAECTKCHRPR